MSLPVCPQCGSAAITWRGDHVPSGHDLCLSCNYLAPVREFHRHAEQLPDYIALKRARQLAVPLPSSEIEQDHARFSNPTISYEPTRKMWWQD